MNTLYNSTENANATTSAYEKMIQNASLQGARIDVRAGLAQKVDADIMIPVYNEQDQLRASVTTLLNYLLSSQQQNNWAFTWNIVVVDNASTDATWAIAQELSQEYPDYVRAVHCNRKGRGLALKLSWSDSKAQVVSYMDVDLATDIQHTYSLIGSLLYGGADVSFGCRLFDDSDVTRSAKREICSVGYNMILQTMLRAQFFDAQCGFKAMRKEVADELLPQVQDNEWFFDTELLVLAQVLGKNMYEFPVHWVEAPGTTVNIPDTVRKDLQGVWRMRKVVRNITRARNMQESQRSRVKIYSSNVKTQAHNVL
ncbi:MAG: glycosyltransferase family 2 protein, partial [Bifidobacteriaceae bacterium]|nr:glycosyltransferase family 2 protein [Bifidobacteriaceae bacterium]